MKITTTLIEKYYAGTCTEQERTAVEQWLENQKTVDEQESKNIADAWIAIKQQIGGVTPIKKRSKRLVAVWAAAASVLLVFSLSLYLLFRTDFASSVKNADDITYTVPFGKKARIMLTDGTVVNLNSGSEIRYSRNFDARERIIHLNGEGYFNVAKDPSRPFRVITENTVTEVLGTVFVLKAYKEEQVTRLTVLEGRVSFKPHKGGTAQILTADERLAWSTATGFTAKEHVYAVAAASWKDQELVLDDLSLAEAIKLIERWYGVTIDIRSGELANKRITATYRNPSLAELMRSLGFTLKFDYKIEKNKVAVWKTGN